MAALGSTDDPDALVPGMLSTVRADANAFRARSAQLDAAAAELARVRVPGWDGLNADAFLKRISAEPRHWRKTADALSAAASKLEKYAAVLAKAKADAAEAIELWAEAEASSAAGMREQKAAFDAFEASLTTTNPGTPPEVLPDPGAEKRHRAERILDDAQGKVLRAGDDAAGGLAEIVISDSAIVDHKGSWDGPGISGDATGSLFKIDPKTGKTGLKWSLDAVAAEGEAHLIEGKWSGGMKHGAAYGKLDASGAVVAKGNASFGMKDEEFAAKAEGSAGVEGAISGRAGYKNVNGGVEVSGSAGAAAELGVTAGKNGVEAAAGAGVLAKVGATADVDVAGVDGKLGVEAMAGWGYEAKLGATRGDDGSWTIGGKAGLAVDVGVEVTPTITINPTEVIDAANDAADFIDGLFD